MWLAKIAKERIDEIENPELGMDRVKNIYEKKGYDKGWIDKRMRGIFALKVQEYKQFKGIKREILRDHMTDLELIITMLGEATQPKLRTVKQ